LLWPPRGAAKWGKMSNPSWAAEGENAGLHLGPMERAFPGGTWGPHQGPLAPLPLAPNKGNRGDQKGKKPKGVNPKNFLPGFPKPRKVQPWLKYPRVKIGNWKGPKKGICRAPLTPALVFLSLPPRETTNGENRPWNFPNPVGAAPREPPIGPGRNSKKKEFRSNALEPIPFVPRFFRFGQGNNFLPNNPSNWFLNFPLEFLTKGA